MAKGRIGLDIGSTAVRAAELSVSRQPIVVRAGAGAAPAGRRRERRGPRPARRHRGDPRSCGATCGFKNRQVWLGVGNQRVVVREIALPFLPEKELRASLGLQVQEFIPMSVDEAVLDYDPIGEFEQDDRKMLRMLLVAAQRVMVDQVVQVGDGTRSSSRSAWTSSRSRSSARSGRPTSRWTSRTTARKRSSTSARTSRTSWCTAAAPRGSSGSSRAAAATSPWRSRARPGSTTTWRSGSSAARTGRGRAGTAAGPPGRAAASGRLRRRDPLLARVLHGAGARGPDLEGARHRRRLAGSRA